MWLLRPAAVFLSHADTSLAFTLLSDLATEKLNLTLEPHLLLFWGRSDPAPKP